MVKVTFVEEEILGVMEVLDDAYQLAMFSGNIELEDNLAEAVYTLEKRLKEQSN